RPDVPEFGLAVHHIVPKRTALRPADPEAVQVGEDWIANGLIRLSVNRQGTLALDDLRTGISYSGLMAFEDGGDVGDGYNYLAPEHDALVRTTDPAPSAPDTAVEIRRRGSSASVVVRQRWYLPAGRDGSGRDMTSQAALDIAWEATLSPGSPRVDVSVSVENAVRDHRLRALFPSGAADADAYQVEQAFGAVTRPIGRPDCTGWREPQPGTGPQKTWVDVADNRQGLAVVNEGLPECEVLDDADRTVAVTLLRCTGQGVGLPEEQRDGQMLGTHRFRLAVVPHTGDWRRGEVWKQAHSFNVPMRAAQTDLHTGPIPDEHSFLTIGPSTLIPSALKRSEDGQGVVIRAYSVADEPVQADIRAHWPTGAVRRVRLDEAPADHSLLVLPAEIATFIADAPSAP
ncbi:MAG: hypothetical protein FJX72_18505, partial [Armatimonadetes bacterium]|nr:hypothetical protein [Armatimonadota bacterium]